MENELNQEGDVKEQAREETLEDASKALSPEEKETSEKQKENEWKKVMQSRTDKAESKAQKLEMELQKLRNEREQQRLEARQKEIADLADEPDEQAKVRRKHRLEDEVNELQKAKAEQEGAVERKYDQAIELASQHNLSLADARDLMDAGTPKEMELLAQLKVAEKAKGLTPKSPQEPSGWKPDSGISDVGEKRTWTQREIDGMSIEEYRANKADIEKAQRAGRIK